MSTGAMPVQALNFSDDGGETCRIGGLCPSILLGWAVLPSGRVGFSCSVP